MIKQDYEIQIKATFKNRSKAEQATDKLKLILLAWATYEQRKGAEIAGINIDPKK